MDDFLAGPEHIFSILESALPEVRAMRKEYPDAVVLPGATSLPTPSEARKKVHKPPVALPAIGIRLARGVIHQLRKEDPAHHQRPAAQRRHPGRALVPAVARSTVSP